MTFEQALERLTEIVHELEEGHLGLDESLKQYEEGVRLMRQCHGLLEKAERKIELLAGIDDEGNAETESLDDDDMTLEEKAESRSRRRSSKMLWDENEDEEEEEEEEEE